MIKPSDFVKFLVEHDINFFAGVPDSLMKNFCNYLSKNFNNKNHIITANEGSAIGIAIGHYLSTSKIPLVYMQNSGLGNAYNPLVSLASNDVYGVPILLIVGWRGEILNGSEQLKDEPQHKYQGKITLNTLNILNIPYEIIYPENKTNYEKIKNLIKIASLEKRPVACVVRKNTFSDLPNGNITFSKSKEAAREVIIREIISCTNDNVAIVGSTGMISRELYEIRQTEGKKQINDFFTVGGMGHASQIALGIAKNLPDKKVICLDGDGSLLMHMGSMAECATMKNLIHIVLNNGVHDSVGGQPTKCKNISLIKIAEGFKYENVYRVKNQKKIRDLITKLLILEGSSFIEVLCKPGYRKNLGRPKESPKENKEKFMNFLIRSR